MNRVKLEGVVAHKLSHIRNYDILVSTLAVTLVEQAVALITDVAIRMMWWNGGRQRREGDHGDSANPLAILGFVLLISSADHRPGDAGDDLASPGDARRRQCGAAHTVSTRTDLRSGKIPATTRP